MHYQQFIETIHKHLEGLFGAEINTSIHSTLKNNGKERIGITISHKDTNISPTIYLEEFYEQYCHDRPFDDIVKNIVSLYHDVKFSQSWDMEQVQDYQRARSYIVFKLIHREKNTSLLKDIPFIPYLDLAIVFYILLETTEKGTATILINNDLLHYWNISLSDIYSAAKTNTPLLMSADFKPMRTIIHELLGKPCTEKDLEENRMYVLSNQFRQFGAACILYHRVLEDIGNQLNEDFYILPSSIHEVIILPACFSPNEEDLNEMIVDINETQVSDEEVLSDHAYYYSTKTNKLVSVGQ